MTAGALVIAALALLSVPPRPSVRPSAPPRRTPRLPRALWSALGVGAAVLTLMPGREVLAVVAGGTGGALAAASQRRSNSASRPSDGRMLALTFDLWGAALDAGMSPTHALAAAAEAAHSVEPGDPAVAALRRAADLLMLGVDPDRAWSDAASDSRLALLAAAVRRSTAGGRELARAVAECAVGVRRADAALARSRAARSSVLMAGPLGLCFLPAFLCLGLAPVVIGLLATLHLGR